MDQIYIDKNILQIARGLGILTERGFIDNRFCTCPGRNIPDKDCPVLRYRNALVMGRGLYAQEILLELIDFCEDNQINLLPADNPDRRLFEAEAKSHLETSEKYTSLLEAVAPLAPYLPELAYQNELLKGPVGKLLTLIIQSGIVKVKEL